MSEAEVPETEATPKPKKRRKGCLIALGICLVLCGGLGIWIGPVIKDLYNHGFLDGILHPVEKRKYSATSEENLKAIYKGMMLYHDSEGQFPVAAGWMDAIKNRINTYDLAKGEADKKLIRPDLLGKAGEYGYSMNDAASGKYKDDVKDPDKTPLIFESKDTALNAHGDPAKTREGLAISVSGKVLKE